ncbi:RNA methyltransferase [Rhizobium sp. CRIBSB]|nr:RNA methyltransferase [Rhizobium sp. CRIBSB]
MTIIAVSDPADPRVAAFRDIRERDLTGRQGCFIAEGSVVLRVLSSPQSLCGVDAVLLAENRLEAHREMLGGLLATVPVYVAPQAILDSVAGFHLHRGVLALGRKPGHRGLSDALGRLGPTTTLLAACGIGNHDNMGALFRAAAAFGVAGVLLDDQCCDPFYRKSIRVSVGAVLRTPIYWGGRAADMVERMLAAGIDVVALTPSAREPLHRALRRGPTGLLVGSEGPGLAPDVIGRCRAVSIPMSAGFDSLNVATAAAIAMNHFTHAATG